MDDALFRAFFEALPEPAYLLEVPGFTIVVSNDAAAALYGYGRDELLGQPASVLWAEPGGDLIELKPGRTATVSRLHRRKDGSTFPTQTRVSLVQHDGRTYAAGIVRDTSDAVRVDRALSESRALLHNAFDDSPFGISISELDTGHIIDVNESFSRMLGYSREEVVSRSSLVMGLVDPVERAALAARLQADQKVSAMSITLRHKNGRLIRCRYWGEVIRTSGGRQIFSTFEDVTDQDALEAERNEVADRLDKLARRVPGVVYQFRVRPDGRSSVPFTSPGMKELFNVDLDVIRDDAASIFTAIHPDDRAGVQASTAQSAASLEVWDHEFRVRLPKGERWQHGNAIPEREADGSTLWSGFITDVTERKLLQLGLAQSDRLTSMGMLAAGVAHEINNPLAYVLANLDQLAEDLPALVEFSRRSAETVREKLGDGAMAALFERGARGLSQADLDELVASATAALEGTQRIRRITKGLGTFARVEQVEAEPVDLNSAVETACTMARNELKFRASLEKDLGELPPVRGTEGKFAQVFLNLLINAAHAIPEGHVGEHRVTVRTWAADGQVCAEVRDTGHGIAKEHLERIFEPFFTTKARGVGSGLGLAISRNLVREFGGDIRVESEVGRGTRFLLRFPEHRQAVLDLGGRVAPTVAGPVRARILVVDDEAPIRRSLARVLSRDHDFVAVGSGREAKELLERDRGFDIILCDLMMPDMTGMELHAWLSEAAPDLAARVVFCSGGAFTPNASAYLERVGNPRLDKPFDHAQLRGLVVERAANRPGTLR